MKTYCVYQETFLFRFYKYFFLSKNDNILYWQRDKSDSSQYIPFPDRSKYYSFQKKSSEHIEQYYSQYYPLPADSHLFVYIKKTVANVFQDYYFFRKSIELVHSSGEKIIIGKNYLKNIYENLTPSKHILLVPQYFIYFILCLPQILKQIFICFLQNTKVEVPDIIYFKKGVWPDTLGINFMTKYFKKKGLSFKGVYFSFSKLIKKYDIYFLSSFIGSKKAVIISLFHVIKYASKDQLMFFRLGIPGRLFYRYLIDYFYALTYMKLGSKVVMGVLEKNYCILMDRNKINGQKICTFSDGFLFYPINSLNYVNADIFYNINPLDTLNINGGKVGITKEVGFIRSNIKAKSRGISTYLKKFIVKIGGYGINFLRI